MYDVLVPLCCFVAFLFLLLVSISAPTVQTIYLFSLSATTVPVRINFGVWGYCIPSVYYSFAGIARVTSAYCSPAQLGWTFDQRVASYLNVALDSINTATTVALVLHPIATGLTFLTLLVSLFLLCTNGGKQRVVSIVTLVLCTLSVALTTIVFLIDIIVSSILRNKVRDATNGVVFLTYGNAIWLTLVAAIALWFAILGACCGVFQRRKQRKPNNTTTNTY